MANIYLLIEGKKEGPYTEEQVRQSLAEGLIPSDLLAWHEGLPDWVQVAGLVGSNEETTPSQSLQEIEATPEVKKTPPRLPPKFPIANSSSNPNLKNLMYVGGALGGAFLLYLAYWVVLGQMHVSMANASTDAAVQHAYSQVQQITANLKAQQEENERKLKDNLKAQQEEKEQQLKKDQQRIDDEKDQEFERYKASRAASLMKLLTELDALEQEKRVLQSSRDNLLNEFDIDPATVDETYRDNP